MDILQINVLADVAESVNHKFCKNLQNSEYCLHSLFPPVKDKLMIPDQKDKNAL